MRPKGNTEELKERRLKAVRLVIEEGLSRAEAGQRLRVHRETVGDWVRAYQSGGEASLEVRPPGTTSRLSRAQVEDVIDRVLAGPRACGFDTDLWTLSRLSHLIRRRHGISYHPDHLSRLAGSWGLSWQKPQRKPIERDDGAVQTWVARQWPRIKKKPAGWGRTLYSSMNRASR